MTPLHKQILLLTAPSVVSNISVPLLGLIDNTIVGHMGNSMYLGAVALGTTLFNMLYWIFAFLRMGTTGLTAQAKGKEDTKEMQGILYQSAIIALIFGLLIIFLQQPILLLASHILHPTDELQAQLSIYYHIIVWGAPAMLLQYSLSGWFIGAQDTRSPMYIAILQNVLNIIVSLTLVTIFHWKIAGVATGTLVAQWFGLLIGIALFLHKEKRTNRIKTIPWQRFFSVNRDIFLRTLCLVAVTVFFTKTGTAQGKEILAANSLLMQFFILYSYFTDGLANAGEALSGKYSGLEYRRELGQTVHALFLWGVCISTVFTLGYLCFGKAIISVLTNIPEVVSTANDYLFWVIIIPFASIAAFVWDGVFIGLMKTRGMLGSMLTASLTFFIVLFLLQDTLHNHALWLAFVIYLFTRGTVQTLIMKRGSYSHSIVEGGFEEMS